MKRSLKIFALAMLKFICFALCLCIMLGVLAQFVLGTGASAGGEQTQASSYGIMDRFDMFVTNTLSEVLDGVLSIKKVYWLNDDDMVAPEPDQSCYGMTEDPASLQWLLDEAADLLEGQDTVFQTDVQIMAGSQVDYYLDETIMVITWKQVMDNSVYTISEVRIADPSQFRRFLAGGEYASSSKYVPSEMAASVNAVVAANGDFYSFRDMGIIVYDSTLMRMEGNEMDTCFITGDGDLEFAHRRDMTDRETTEQYLQEEGVRFSLAFGPALVENGELCYIDDPYPVGEGNVANARAALCQVDTLHYLLVAVSPEPPYQYGHVLSVFADNLLELGCDMAYNLDGGQSGTIVMNDVTINYVYERLVSDIIYFATAVPNGG